MESNICPVCKKPVEGVKLEGADVYHFECAFAAVEEVRERMKEYRLPPRKG